MKKLRIFAIIVSVLFVVSLAFPATLFADSRADVEAFVTRFYRQTLDRAPDAPGLEGWVGQLLSGNLSGADVAERFIFSQEFEAKSTSDEQFLEVMYRAFFNRPPDPNGYAGWLSVLQGGRSRRYVLSGFVNSVEFANLCANYGIESGSISGEDRGSSSQVQARSPRTLAATGNINVVCMGDSLIVKSDWVPKLAGYLRSNYPQANFNVIASAVNGETAGGGYNRFDSTVAVHNPDIIVIAYGTNDAGNGIGTYEKYLERLVEKALSTGAIVFVQNFGPLDTKAFPTKSDYMEYVSEAAEVASEYGVQLIDVHGPLNADRSANLLDWCHYSSQGATVVARTVYGYLSAVLVK